MKIAVHHQMHHGHSATRSASERDGVSFSELMEGGASGATVSRGRALGFAETGLLGLHYAHQLGSSQAQPKGTVGVGLNTPPEEVFSIALAPSVQSEADLPGFIPASADSQGQTEGLAKREAFVNESAGRQIAQELSAEALIVIEPESADAPTVARAIARAIRAERRDVPFNLLVSGTADATSILFEFEKLDPGDAEDLEALAHKIASEFGVNVKRFVTRTSFGLHFSSGS